MKNHHIDLVFDVGANVGQYAMQLRDLGYEGRIVSFEPLSDASAALEHSSARDPKWQVIKVALGEREAELTLHVAGNSQSSSLLDMLPRHVLAAPESRYTRDESVLMTRLDSMVERHAGPDDRLFVKLDVQGYERQVLAGAGDAIDRIVGLQVELSLVPLYEGGALIDEMMATLKTVGFTPMSLEPVFWDVPSGQLLAADGIFFRS